MEQKKAHRARTMLRVTPMSIEDIASVLAEEPAAIRHVCTGVIPWDELVCPRTVAEAMQLYLADGLSGSAVCRQTGLSLRQFHTWRQDLRVPRRAGRGNVPTDVPDRYVERVLSGESAADVAADVDGLTAERLRMALRHSGVRSCHLQRDVTRRRGERAARIERMRQLFAGGMTTPNDLAAELGISRTTAYRDMEKAGLRVPQQTRCLDTYIERVDEGESLAAVARAAGVSRQLLHPRAQRAGVYTRIPQKWRADVCVAVAAECQLYELTTRWGVTVNTAERWYAEALRRNNDG